MCDVLYKGTATFSCVLSSLVEVEADSAEAEEPGVSSASAGCWAASVLPEALLGRSETEMVAVLCQAPGRISPPLQGFKNSRSSDEV